MTLHKFHLDKPRHNNILYIYNNMNKSELLFLSLCIPSRIALALGAKEYPKELIPFAITFASGFMYYYLTGTRAVGAETFGRPIWWNDLRPAHAALWMAFALMAFLGKKWAWKFLAVDVILGLIAFFFLKK